MDKSLLQRRFELRVRAFARHVGAKFCLGALIVMVTTVLCSLALSDVQFQAYKQVLAMIVGAASVLLVFGYVWAMLAVIQNERQEKSDSAR